MTHAQSARMAIRNLLERWAHDHHDVPVRIRDDWWAERWREHPIGIRTMSLSLFKALVTRERRTLRQEDAKVFKRTVQLQVRQLRRRGGRHD